MARLWAFAGLCGVHAVALWLHHITLRWSMSRICSLPRVCLAQCASACKHGRYDY